MTHYGRLLRCSSIASNDTKLHNIDFLSVSWSVLIMEKRKCERESQFTNCRLSLCWKLSDINKIAVSSCISWMKWL
jgi:hypothetical protein